MSILYGTQSENTLQTSHVAIFAHDRMLKDCHSRQNYKETEYKDTGMTENKQVAEIVIQHIAYSYKWVFSTWHEWRK